MRRYIFQRSVISKNPKIANRVEQLKGQGFSLRDITKRINQEFGLEISHQTIANYFQSRGILTSKMIEGDQNLKEDIKKQVLDVLVQLKEINKQMWELMHKTEKDGLKIGVAREILRQLEFQQSLLEGLQTKTVINYTNHVELTQNIVKNLNQLEKSGYITINRAIRQSKKEEDLVCE
jgi:intein-encoded DNA endonuclease-like protein